MSETTRYDYLTPQMLAEMFLPKRDPALPRDPEITKIVDAYFKKHPDAEHGTAFDDCLDEHRRRLRERKKV